VRGYSFCKHLLILFFGFSERFINNLSYGYYNLNDGYNLKPFPDEWKNETKETIQDNNKFKEFFEDHFDWITPERFDELNAMTDKERKETEEGIGKERLEQILNQYPQFKGKNIKDELKKMKQKFIYDCQTRAKDSKLKGIWYGFREASED
jgi:hypothetical protein